MSEPNLSVATIANTTEAITGAFQSCNFQSKHFNLLEVGLWTAAALFGILYCFFGYRFYKVTFLLTGFMLTFTISKFALGKAANLVLASWVTGAIAAICGSIVGTVLMACHQIAFFATGLTAGVIVCTGILGAIPESCCRPEHTWVLLLLITLFGLISGLTTLRFKKTLTLVSTAIIGSTLICLMVDYFVELMSLPAFLAGRVIYQKEKNDLCWFSIAVLILWPTITGTGILVQGLLTSIGVNHKEDEKHDRLRNQRIQMLMQNANDPSSPQHNRYRHLYQIRRSNGDVISQSYIRSIQNRLSTAVRKKVVRNVSEDEQQLSQGDLTAEARTEEQLPLTA